MAKDVRVAVTGASGQIGYSLLFRIASGEVFGPDTRVHLNLVELPVAVKAAEGTAMELADCAFPTLGEVNCYDSPAKGFEGVHWALLVGAAPRGPGMERSDLIRGNGPIFVDQGKALARADSEVRCVVVGNPCNTNALIAMHNCREVPATRFSAMMALDENRARGLLAERLGVNPREVTKLVVWGNHSPTMYPDFEHAEVGGKPLEAAVGDRAWLEGAFLETVQKRGAAIIAARGKSSAASAASACLDHVRRLSSKTPEGDWFSAAVPSDGGSYGVPAGLIFSFPLAADGAGGYRIVPGLELSHYAQGKLETTIKELETEREVVRELLS